jgi:hypothetical protein
METCFVMIVRNDWNTSSSTLTQATTFPTREIYICPWSSVSYHGTFQDLTILNNVIYEEYMDNYTSEDGSVSWPAHIFIAQTNTLSVTNLDMMAFSYYLFQTYNISSS